jgi:hypothetical protein
MKKFHVRVALSHESFGGFDHKDGVDIFVVDAKDKKSAEKKALAESKKKSPLYHREIETVEEIKS